MPCDYHLLPHEGIRSLKPYIPGKSVHALAEEQGLTDIIKLASNENPWGCSPLVTQALANISNHQIATYVTGAHHPFRKKLAQKLNIDADRLTLGNGSDALIPLLQTAFALHCDKHVLTHEYAFIAYGIYAKTLGIPVIATPTLPNWCVDIEAMIAACNEKTALIFIANPNNPTGIPVSKENIKRLLDHIPETTLLVIDEAYYEFGNDTPSAMEYLPHYPNLVIMRTFSKAYGLAGLRLGYAISSLPVSTILNRALPPFTVNDAALVAASAAMDDEHFLKHTIENNKEGLKQLQQGLHAQGITSLPTTANFITFDCKRDATSLYEALQQHGIIVRPLHPYGLGNFLRVTIGTPHQNLRFLDTLKELYHEK